MSPARLRIGQRLAIDALVVWLFFRVVSVLAVPLTWTWISYDERFYVYGGYSILHGEVPYKDFQVLKGPLLTITEALGLALFGLQDQGYRVLPVGMAIGSVVALVAALLQRGTTRLLSLALGLLVVSIWFDPGFHDTSLNDAESLTLGYYVFGLALLLLRLRGRAQIFAWGMGGALVLAASLVKENFLPVSLGTIFALGCDPALAGVRRHYARCVAAGALVLACAIMPYLAASGGLTPYLVLLGRYPKYAATYGPSIGRFAATGFWASRLEEWKHLREGALTDTRMIAWAPLLVTSAFAAKRRPVFAAACALVFLATAFTVCVGHSFWPHYYALLAGGLGVLCLPGIDAVSSPTHVRREGARAWFGAVALAVAWLGIHPRYEAASTVADAHPQPIDLHLPPDFQAFIDSHSQPWDYILTTGTPDLYFYAGRLGAHEDNGFYDELLEMYPGTTDAEKVSEARARLEAKMPKIVFIDSSPIASPDRSKRTIGALVYPFLEAHHYEKLGDGVYVLPRTP